MIKMVVSDMDGTLLNQQSEVSRQNADAVRFLQKQGIRFLVCTGRSYSQACAALESSEIQIRCDKICMNGAAVYDVEGNVTEQYELTQEQVQKIISIRKKHPVSLDIMTDDGSFIVTDREVYQEFAQSYLKSSKNPCSFLSPEGFSALNRTCFKVSVLSDRFLILERIRKELSRIACLTVSSSYQTNLELTHENAQKGEALKRFAKREGIRLDEVMGIGDNDNDLSLLSLPLGYSVAMGNATEKLKEICSFVTESNQNNGVAKAIFKMLDEIKST